MAGRKQPDLAGIRIGDAHEDHGNVGVGTLIAYGKDADHLLIGTPLSGLPSGLVLRSPQTADEGSVHEKF